jgi:hypothetical protein
VARDQVDETLFDRAMNETARLRDTFERLTGARGADATQVADEAMAQVKPITDRLFGMVGNVPLDARGANRVAEVVDALENDGWGVLPAARRLGGMPAALRGPDGQPIPMTVGQAHKLRVTLDAMFNDPQTSAEAMAGFRLQEARSAIDEVVKAGGGNPAAAQAVQLADDVFARAKQVGESFSGGVKAVQSGRGPTAARIMGEQANPEMARAGAGSEIIQRLNRVVNEGGTQNPGPRVTGGQAQRDITRMAFPDDQTFGQFREEARGITRRLGNMRTATGGSQTSTNLIDQIGEFVDPQAIAGALTGNPGSWLQKALNRGIVRRVFDANAKEADAAVQYMLAGGADRMTEREAVAMLQRLAPTVRERAARTTTRGALAGTGALNAASPAPIRRRDRR